LNPNRPHFAPWDEREWPRLLSPEEGARRVRIFAAVERKQAELLEKWAGIATEPHVQTALKRHARNAAWHADLWEKEVSDGAAGASSNGSPALDADLTAFLDALAAPTGAGELVEFLAGVYRVLIPRKVTAYTYYQRAIGTQDSDADWRWIDFIMKDEFDAIRDGELSLQSVLTTDADVERASRRREQLEKQMLNIGGLVGPDSLGMAATAGASN
jgi:hypothetical protein